MDLITDENHVLVLHILPSEPGSPSADCAVDVQERIPCGPPGTSASVCRGRGCCVGGSKPSCYYPLDGKTSVSHCSPSSDLKLWCCYQKRPAQVSATEPRFGGRSGEQML
uniref:P-type domain-containing protein n=1 Tax=Oryzias melastigma TaxID=30732 RepID=A0A3B3CW97_ORYME